MKNSRIAGWLRRRWPRIWFLATLTRHSGQWKHGPRWLRSLQPSYLLTEPSPWMTFDSIRAIRTRLHPGMAVFEFGSGGSTLFWLRHGCRLVSIEHDPEWYAVLRDRLSATTGVDYRLIPPEPRTDSGAEPDPADPSAYASMDERFRLHDFRPYASSIDAYPDAHFDIVIVDGRSRPSCVVHAAPKVKPGGMLVLDNAERAYYLEQASGALAGFVLEEYAGCGPCNFHLWKTNVYIRPL